MFSLILDVSFFSIHRLTGDVSWPVSTPVSEAIGAEFAVPTVALQLTSSFRMPLSPLGPLAGAFPILSLRTSKADVVVGVDQARADALDVSDEKWRVNGK